ncbi:MAG: RsbRD N-terminal domain-containing protein [Polyangiaceae bacterium]|nr:RsbRD N-terminal domain-containing protein [Polyangiaceae bacterium]
MDQTLVERRSHILSKWLDAVLSRYPEQTRGALARPADALANPMGAIIVEGLGAVLDCVSGAPSTTVEEPLDRLMRLWALDGPEVSHALGFLEALKGLLCAELSGVPGEGLAVAEARIDELAARAAERFAAARRALVEIRTREQEHGRATLLERLQRERQDRRKQPCQR